MLEAIFFDIDDTLFSTTAFAARARENSIDAMIEMGVSTPREELLRELREVIAEFSSNYEHHFERLLARLPREHLAGLNQALVVAAAVVAYHETKFRELAAHDDVTDVLQVLARKGYRLGIISSGLTFKQMEKLIRLRVIPSLDPQAILISEEAGINKPNPKLFLRACERAGVNPARCMYVGDHPVNDVDAAKAAGMMTVWNRRDGRHQDARGRTVPDFVVHNFWDLLAVVERIEASGG
jgi:putative hydrolase of the HAD superfamily